MPRRPPVPCYPDTPGLVDAVGVALASVITSGVLGITTSSIAVWSARQNAKLARETRTHQRLAESYLEVLRIVEREGQWIEARITNMKIAIEEWATVGAGAVTNPEQFEEAGSDRVNMPPEPAVTDRAAIAAHLAAFGSPKVLHHGDIVVTMDDDPPTKQRTIRLDLDIDERLTAYARRTRRTVNATVNFLLGEALQGAESDLAVHLNRPVRPLNK
jgi:hypothetical protein